MRSPWKGLGPRYHLLFSAYVVSDAGTWMYRLTLPLLVLHLTGSALQAAALYALEYGPFLVMSLPGGFFADRFNRKALLVIGDLTAGVLALSLAVLVSVGVTTLWAIYLVALLLACVDPIYHPAFQAILPAIVDRDKLDGANSLIGSSDYALSLAGPVLAGALISFFGYEAAIYINASSFIGSALIISVIRVGVMDRDPRAPQAVEKPQKPGFVTEIRDGLRYMTKENRTLLSGSLLFAGTNFGIWLIQATLVFYLTTYLKLSATLVGVVYGAQGAGAVIGAVVAPTVMRWLGNGRTIVLSTICAGLLTILLYFFRDIAGVSLTFAAIFVLGSINVVSWFTLRQRIVAPEMLGRAVATTRMIAYATIPVASIVGGLLVEATHDMYLLILIGAVIRLGTGVISLRTGLMKRQEEQVPVAAAQTAS